MRSFRQTLVIAGLTLCHMGIPMSQAQTNLPPAKSYFTDLDGRRLGVKERWSEDESGRRHGRYLRYNSEGQILESATYVHGSKTGSATVYSYTGGYFFKDSPLKSVGQYENGMNKGWWTYYDHSGRLSHKYYWMSDAGGFSKQIQYNVETGEAGPVMDNFGVVLKKGQNSPNTPAPVQAVPVASPVSAEERKLRSEELEKSQREKAELAKVIHATRDINTRGISFFQDSYILNRAGRERLDTIIAYVNIRKQINKPIKSIYVGVLTPKASKEMESKRAMYVLSANRGVVIRDYMRQKLDDKSVEITTYPLGGEFNRQRNQVEDYQEAVLLGMNGGIGSSCSCLLTETDKATLAEYNLPAATDQILPNADLKQVMLKAIRAAFNNAQKRYDMDNVSTGRNASENGLVYIIPTEFWLPSITGIMPITLTTSEETATFRSQVNALVDELNKTYRVNVKPEVFFSQDLKRRPNQ